jgi:hypothetical protein
MDRKNGKRIWPVESMEEGDEGVSLVHESTDSNIITLSKEIFVYAFFDSYEREDPLTTDTPFIGLMRNDHRPLSFEERPELLSARFDCVSVFYFDAGLEFWRGFYQSARAEDLEAEEQDLEEEYWHNEEYAEKHAALLAQFIEQSPKEFGILYLVARRDDDAEAFVERYLLPGTWVGFGLTDVEGAPPFVTMYPHDDDELAEPTRLRLTSIWELTPERINSLRHVFSLDFAADAILPDDPEGEEEEEVEIPVYVSIPMRSGGYGSQTSFSQQFGVRKPRFPGKVTMKTGLSSREQSVVRSSAFSMYAQRQGMLVF